MLIGRTPSYHAPACDSETLGTEQFGGICKESFQYYPVLVLLQHEQLPQTEEDSSLCIRKGGNVSPSDLR